MHLLNRANQNQTSKRMKPDSPNGPHGLIQVFPGDPRILGFVERTGKMFAELPWDVLGVICERLDFDDLFQFSRVCTNWRDFYKSIDKSNFLTSQEPLLLEALNCPHKGPCSFISLPKQKVYPLKNMMMNMMSYSKFPFPIYITYSSGYFIIIADNSSFLLINPFTREKKKVIYPSTFKFSYSLYKYNALLAFDKYSEEFVLVILCKKSKSVFG
ncbi:F-box protein At5g25290 [Vicia villosa]|uniref:F-box protein At5g25290 n=1 Tax=Vicia villosa TaxID=3911 RepID=UPI00273B7F1C|nr:F-box protein At5g25290 [Vicia villosa]